MERLIDLHLHSFHSDGVLSPAVLVQMASQKNLQAIALADHDSTAGIDEALAAGLQWGVEVIPAIELSVEFPGFHDIHLLGYFIDHHDPVFQQKLALFQERRDARVQGIVARINEQLAREEKGEISYEEVAALAAGAIGRPHIAQVLIAHGLASDMQDAFTRYLIKCNVPKQYFPMAEALAEIRRLNGVAVLAHPMTVTDDRHRLRSLVGELAHMGLEGLEVFTNTSYKDDTAFLEGLAYRLKLVKTGGSDFHGIEDEVEMGCGRGGLYVPYSVVEALKLRRAARDTTEHP